MFVTENKSPLMAECEVSELLKDVMSSATRRRAKEAGLFPARVRTCKRKIAYQRSSIESYLADPQQWQCENAEASK